MRRLRFAMSVAISILLESAVQAGDAWYQEFEEGQIVARRQQKDLLVDFGGSDWCLPCRQLKERILSRPEFVRRATETFVLIDVDLPHRRSIDADRRERYQRLQERFKIKSFPSVILATDDGRPYARTTYLPEVDDPDRYWRHLQKLRDRGDRLKAALTRAKDVNGRARAVAIVNGLSELHPDFVPTFYGDWIDDLRQLDPTDTTQYLAFLAGRQQIDRLKSLLDRRRPDGTAYVDVESIDKMITISQICGESLQEALVLRAFVQVVDDRPFDALDSLGSVLTAQAGRSRFDHGDILPLDAQSIEAIKVQITKGKAEPRSRLEAYYALHQIFERELPDPYELSCGEAFRPRLDARQPIGEHYGAALIKSTMGLRGKARALALRKGLEGTVFFHSNSVRTIVTQLIPELIGTDDVKDYLPGDGYKSMAGTPIPASLAPPISETK